MRPVPRLPGARSPDPYARRRRGRIVAILAAVAVLAALGVFGPRLLNATVLDAPQVSEPALIWAVGDAADGGEDAEGVAELVRDDPPDRFLYLGDVYETGTAEEFDENYDPLYGRFAKRTAPTPGNHEWENAEEGYFPYWEEATGEEQPPYYSFELAGWEILSLNSEIDHDEGSEQVGWLERQLDEEGTCRLAFWHRPLYSAGEIHGDYTSVEPFWEALRDHAVLIVNAHEHDMQRFEPIDGITQLVSGAGGRTLYSLDEEYPRLAFGDDGQFGALRLELEPGRARYEFVTADGETLDSGEVDCEPSPA
jgi:hypothetical protein